MRLFGRLAVGVAVFGLGLAVCGSGGGCGTLAGPLPVLIDHQPPFGSPTAIIAVSCASPSICVAVDEAGNALTSTDPAGGPSTWRRFEISGLGAIPASGVLCVSASFCIVGGYGVVATSRNPTAGKGAWTVKHINHGLGSVSCASASFCVAVDYGGNVAVSTAPTGGASAWRVRHIDTAM